MWFLGWTSQFHEVASQLSFKSCTDWMIILQNHNPESRKCFFSWQTHVPPIHIFLYADLHYQQELFLGMGGQWFQTYLCTKSSNFSRISSPREAYSMKIPLSTWPVSSLATGADKLISRRVYSKPSAGPSSTESCPPSSWSTSEIFPQLYHICQPLDHCKQTDEHTYSPQKSFAFNRPHLYHWQ